MKIILKNRWDNKEVELLNVKHYGESLERRQRVITFEDGHIEEYSMVTYEFISEQ